MSTAPPAGEPPPPPWKKVVYSVEVDPFGDTCPECGGDYTECPCPGPTMEGMDYKYFDVQGMQVLYARPEEDEPA